MPKYAKKIKQQPNNISSTKTTNWLIWGAVVVIGIIGLGYLLYSSLREPSSIADLIRFSGEERGHDNDAVYVGDLPPVGGTHSDIWQNCGIYDEVIESENAVHSLEHGAVWITYLPDMSQRDITTLQDIVRGETHLLLSPFPEQSSLVILTAWETQLELDSVQDKRLQTFIDRYRQGPTTPERGATCQNGVGVPLP